jgi:hypothetical protein
MDPHVMSELVEQMHKTFTSLSTLTQTHIISATGIITEYIALQAREHGIAPPTRDQLHQLFATGNGLKKVVQSSMFLCPKNIYCGCNPATLCPTKHHCKNCKNPSCLIQTLATCAHATKQTAHASQDITRAIADIKHSTKALTRQLAEEQSIARDIAQDLTDKIEQIAKINARHGKTERWKKSIIAALKNCDIYNPGTQTQNTEGEKSQILSSIIDCLAITDVSDMFSSESFMARAFGVEAVVRDSDELDFASLLSRAFLRASPHDRQADISQALRDINALAADYPFHWTATALSQIIHHPGVCPREIVNLVSDQISENARVQASILVQQVYTTSANQPLVFQPPDFVLTQQRTAVDKLRVLLNVFTKNVTTLVTSASELVEKCINLTPSQHKIAQASVIHNTISPASMITLDVLQKHFECSIMPPFDQAETATAVTLQSKWNPGLPVTLAHDVAHFSTLEAAKDGELPMGVVVYLDNSNISQKTITALDEAVDTLVNRTQQAREKHDREKNAASSLWPAWWAQTPPRTPSPAPALEITIPVLFVLHSAFSWHPSISDTIVASIAKTRHHNAIFFKICFEKHLALGATWLVASSEAFK